jgi:hypothetical protein
MICYYCICYCFGKSDSSRSTGKASGTCRHRFSKASSTWRQTTCRKTSSRVATVITSRSLSTQALGLRPISSTSSYNSSVYPTRKLARSAGSNSINADVSLETQLLEMVPKSPIQSVTPLSSDSVSSKLWEKNVYQDGERDNGVVQWRSPRGGHS